MKNLIKVVLIATAFAFAAGCADTCNKCAPEPVKCPCKKVVKCKKVTCGKLGVEKRKCDTTK